MAKLLTLLEQHLNRQPPTVVTQATTWWETVLALVKLQEIGLGVHLPVKVALFLGLPTIHFLIAYSKKTGGERSGSVYQISDVIV